MAFIMSVQAPDNPFTTETPVDVKARGKAAWDKAACGTCHRGEALTDDRFYDVGTLVTTGTVIDRREFLFHGGLNTPSLLGIARTAPFLHDGSAPTLKARILMGKERDRHGLTSRLSEQEVDDLVAYVRAL
jgi:cytochrome c peroxidase